MKAKLIIEKIKRYKFIVVITTLGVVLGIINDFFGIIESTKSEELIVDIKYTPLDGHPIIENDIYTQGLKFNLSFKHNLQGTKNIHIDNITIKEIFYDSLYKSEYLIDSEDVGGSGIETSYQVNIIKDNQGINSIWNLNNKKLISTDNNILNTDTPISFKLSSSDDSDVITGYFLEMKNGLSEYELYIKYSIGGLYKSKSLTNFKVYN